MRDYPDLERMRTALKHLPDPVSRWDVIKRAGTIHKVVTREGENPVYLQQCGIDLKDAREIMRISSTHSNIPEPLRAAHLIATGIVCGESKGKA